MSATAAPDPRSARSGPLASVAEYFTLQQAAEINAKLPQDARTEIADALALGRQKSDAADSLWANGHSAEGLRLAGEALEVTLKVAPRYVSAMGLTPVAPPVTVDAAAETVAATEGEGETSTGAAEPEPAPIDERDLRAIALRARGASEREVASIESALSAYRGTTLPLRDVDVSPAHGELYQQVTGAQHTVMRRFGAAAMAKRQILATRIGRIASAAVVAIAALAGLYLLTRKPEYTVHSSANWANAATHDHAKAVDGRTDTWWLLPDGEPGWLEVRFGRPRSIERVRLLNTSNAPHMDRGTDQYRVELRNSAGEVVQTVENRFPHRPDPQWAEHRVDAQDVSAIRFVVESHHRASGGLAEIEWN